jgi:hypothetical protein
LGKGAGEVGLKREVLFWKLQNGVMVSQIFAGQQVDGFRRILLKLTLMGRNLG